MQLIQIGTHSTNNIYNTKNAYNTCINAINANAYI